MSSRQGLTLWLTGLSGAGKSTVAHAVADHLVAGGRAVEVLDGDELREALSPGLGFTRADRDAHVRRVGYLARLLARHGVVAIVPVIAPYAEVREEIAAAHAAEGLTHLEVYVSTDVAECARRDVKGLYARHAAGEISGLTGVDDPYEAPTDPDLLLDTTGVPLTESRDAVLHLLTRKGLS
ncbi:MAG: adenylyl-sulfate kinase [Mobilicoccus sp.]|nr:adenylyl-sulfate kinase [Mobilicoccus sp.]